MNVSEDKKPWLDVLVPLWKKPEPYFEIPPKAAKYVPGKKDPYRVVPDDKSVPTHAVAGTKESLVAVYPEAIAISTPMGRERAGGWLSICICGMGVVMALHSGIFMSTDVNGEIQIFPIVMSLLAGGGFLLFGTWMYRLLQHTPPERPILFSRKARRVDYFVPHPPPFWKFWKPVPVEIRSHSWDDTRVRCYKTHHATGVTVREVFNLLLLWGGEDGNPRLLKDFVAVGFQDDYSDAYIFQLWEHIRRYMEEGGPPIQPGEKLREPGNSNPPLEFPPEILADAGGPPLSRQQVARLAELAELEHPRDP